MKYLFYILCVIYFTNLHSQGVDILDCPCSMNDNPLKGINSFTVFIEENSKETDLFLLEINKLGTVKKFVLKDSKGINFEGMGTGARLLLVTSELKIIGEKKSSLSRTSLLLSSSVEVLKSKNRLNDSYIWASNAFSTNEKRVEAIKQISSQFISDYQKSNPHIKPTFFVYL